MRLLMFAAIALLAGAALAEDDFPVLDVEAACAKKADYDIKHGKMTRNESLNTCHNEIQRDYDISRLYWPLVGGAVRTECLTHARTFGDLNFYRALGPCLEAKSVQDAGKREAERQRFNPPPPFRY